LRELRKREVIRTTNAPTGDYAEFLVARLLGVKLARIPKRVGTCELRSQNAAGEIQGGSHPRAAGERQLSPFRSFEFDEVAIALFDDDYRVWRAVRLPAKVAEERSTYRSHVNGHILFAKDQLLDDPLANDITSELQADAGEL
jgi:hypothetical protein